MCDLLLPLGIKELSACSVFFSIDNCNQKRFLKTIFQLKIKAKVSTKCIYYKCTRFLFCFLPWRNFAEL